MEITIAFTCSICKIWNNRSFSEVSLWEYRNKHWTHEDLIPWPRCVMRDICTTSDTTYRGSAQQYSGTLPSIHVRCNRTFGLWLLRMADYRLWQDATQYHILSHNITYLSKLDMKSWQVHCACSFRHFSIAAKTNFWAAFIEPLLSKRDGFCAFLPRGRRAFDLAQHEGPCHNTQDW